MDREEGKKKLIIYGMYCNYIKEIKHFDNLQTRFRILGSTVLLGTIAAIGFLFSLQQLDLPYRRTLAASFVSIIGIVGLLTLWRVDLKYYERLLVSNFAEIFRLEAENDWLPRPHHNMLFGKHKQDHPSNVAFYYIGGVCTITLTIGLTITYDFYDVHHLPIFAFISGFMTIALMGFFYFFIKKKTKKRSNLLKELNYIEEEE